MAKNFSNLRAKMTPASRARSDVIAQRLLREMPLHELRLALNLTQEELASVLQVNQAAISKMERRTDMYISTLARFIEAMGGTLEVRAQFPDGEVKIISLEGLRSSTQKDPEAA